MVTAFLPSIQVDDCSLTLWTPAGTEHRLYFSASKDVPEGMLYTSRRSGGWSMIPWARQEYVLKAASSHLAAVICRIRDRIGVLFDQLPTIFYDADHWAQHCCNLALRVIVLSSAISTMGWVATAIMIGEIAALRWFVRSLAHADWSAYYPLAATTVLGGLALGAAAWIPSVYCLTALEKGVEALMHRQGIYPSEEQDAIKYMKDPDSAVAMGFYASIGAPFIEEFIFRGILHDAFKSYEARPTKGRIARSYTNLKQFVFGKEVDRHPTFSWPRAMTVLKTSILFGLMHCSPAQGWSNLPIALVTGSLGLAAGILREITGNLWAPMAFHSMHNTIITLRLWDMIPPLPFLD